MKNHTFLTVLLLCMMSFQSGYSQKTESRYGGDFLKIPPGVRAAGMGSAFTAIANDASGFFYNPAGSSLVPGSIVSSQIGNQFGTITDPASVYTFVGYHKHLGSLGAFSFNWIRLGVDDIHFLEDLGLTQSERRGNAEKYAANAPVFGNAQDAFILNFSKEIGTVIDFGWNYFKVPYRIPIGINLKYIRQSFSSSDPAVEKKVGQSASGIGIDAGFMIITNLNDYVARNYFGTFSFGLVSKDISNTILRWDDQIETSVPRSWAWSVAYLQPLDWIKSSVQIALQEETDYETYKSYGVEYTYDQLLQVRAGYRREEPTMGVGLFLFKSLSIQYSFQKHELGNPHQVGLSFNLDSWLK